MSAYEDVDEGIDGVHYLRRRLRTRLWFRAMPANDDVPQHLRAAIENAQLSVIAPDLVEAVRVRPVDFQQVGTDVLIAEWTGDLVTDLDVTRPLDSSSVMVSTEERQQRMLRRLGSQHDIVPADAASTQGGEALTDWRIVPLNAPTLLLAANELLDGRSGGAILGPGVRYRVLSAGDGVVGLEVFDEQGIPTIGYCNAVDLLCIEPMIVGLAGGNWKTSTRQRLQRLSQSISHVTGSLIGTTS